MNYCTQKKNFLIKKDVFGFVSGKAVEIYTISNGKGFEIRITNYGAIVQSLFVPGKNGTIEDVVLGYESLDGYLTDSPYFGAVVGRYGNRIAGGNFSLDGISYTLVKNNGVNHLHGGTKGFDKVIWDAHIIEGNQESGLDLSYLSEDGEEGYPGNLNVNVKYVLTVDNELKIIYSATTDKATPCNLTHHGYFNLSGDLKQEIVGHILWMNADYYTPVDSGLIPTGEIRPVKGTPFDFKSPTLIGSRIGEENLQLQYGLGYDHNWVLNGADGTLMLQAFVYHPESGRKMEIYTTEPGLQFYSGNFLDGSNIGKNNIAYAHRTGLCLETQHFPDSPNKPGFPSTILQPGKKYFTETVYRFSVE